MAIFVFILSCVYVFSLRLVSYGSDSGPFHALKATFSSLLKTSLFLLWARHHIGMVQQPSIHRPLI